MVPHGKPPSTMNLVDYPKVMPTYLARTQSISFRNTKFPSIKRVNYGNFICDLRPLKTEPYRVRLTVGGDKPPYGDNAGSPAASLLEMKLIINSTISDAHKGARFMCADLKDHFLASPMKDAEYMRIKYKYFSAPIREQYKLDDIINDDGYMCTSKARKACMASSKPPFLLISTSLLNSPLMGTILAPIPQDCGCTTLAKPSFASASTILASSTSTTPTLPISSTLYANTTKYQ
jgi:hypothetical protein